MSVAVHAFSDGAAGARSLAERLKVPFAEAQTHRFPDGELLVTVPDPAGTVIVHQSLDAPNEKLVELALAAEAWRRLGATRLVLAAPYLAYMRQDKAFAPGQAISQRALARWLSGLFDRLVTVDAHLHRTHDIAALFAPAAAVNLTAAERIADWLARHPEREQLFLLGPDQESTPLVAATAKPMGVPWATFTKTRQGDREVSLSVADGVSLRDRHIVLVDDICSSGTTLVAACAEALALGARQVSAVVVHALYGEEVATNLRQAGLAQVVSTSSVPHPSNRIDLAPLLAEALSSEITA